MTFSIFSLSVRAFETAALHQPHMVKLSISFLPETFMRWDQAIVRNTYKLRPDPESFVSYQRFGWKLLHHVTRGKSVKELRQLERDHATSVGYFEPITMILDHLAFSPKLSARAVAALGGPSHAFSEELLQ